MTNLIRFCKSYMLRKLIPGKAIQEEAATEAMATQGEVSMLGEIFRITIHIEGINTEGHSILEGEV